MTLPRRRSRRTSAAPGAPAGCSTGWARRPPPSRRWTAPGWVFSSSQCRPACAWSGRAARPPPAAHRGRRRPRGSVQAAQHVVVPPGRERERQPRRRRPPRRCSCRRSSRRSQQVLLAAAAGRDRRGAPRGPLVREQALEHADRGVERRADGAVLGLAVPAAVLELLAEQPRHDAVDVHPEVGAERDGAAVDARLDLALEERLPVVLPAAVARDQLDRLARPGRRRVDAEVAQQHQGRARSTSRAGPAGDGRRRTPAGKQAPPAHWPSASRR